jgi:Cu-Zn family superoxide dismutase
MTRLFRHTAIFASVGALALAACSREAEAPVANDDMAMTNDMMTNDMMASNDMMAGNGMAGAGQSFNFAGADGKALGSVSVSEDANGATMTVNASAHWNPTTKQHGRDNPRGAHLGDFANLEVAGAGTATASFTVAGAMMASGANMLADADGTAIVVHAKADDYKTDPAGDSGDRIACAVIAAPK